MTTTTTELIPDEKPTNRHQSETRHRCHSNHHRLFTVIVLTPERPCCIRIRERPHMRQFLAVILFFMLPSFLAIADPGQIDAKGGHYNQQTGEYHYHRQVAPPLDVPMTTIQIQSSAITNAKRDAIRDANRDAAWYAAGFFLGAFGVGAAYVMAPQVPPINLLGKSPEYILFYTDAYQQEMRTQQVQQATTGCLIGAGAVVFYYLYSSGQL